LRKNRWNNKELVLLVLDGLPNDGSIFSNFLIHSLERDQLQPRQHRELVQHDPKNVFTVLSLFLYASNELKYE
jgi:hypothetical protein